MDDSGQDVVEERGVEEGRGHHVLKPTENEAGFRQRLLPDAGLDLPRYAAFDVKVAMEEAEEIHREDQFQISVDDRAGTEPQHALAQVDRIEAGGEHGDVEAGKR